MSTGQSTPMGCDRPSPPALLKGIEQFNDREYFECHETLEALWNIERAQAAQASKAIDQGTSGILYCDNLYKGILQVGVGCYHLLRHNYHGATIKLQSGADYLEPFAPRCMGVEVGQLIADARRLRAELVALGRERFEDVDLSLLPLVRLTAEPD
jgi:predicted metal-dependent hydrolase